MGIGSSFAPRSDQIVTIRYVGVSESLNAVEAVGQCVR